MECRVGKYRARVVNINDPEKRGRIKVECPMTFGKYPSNWCEPCIPVAYDNGGDFAIPKVGETVWIEFENGDTHYPVYSGGWFSMGNSPSVDYNTDNRYITWGNCKIICEESKMTLEVGKSKIELNENGSIVIEGTSINLKKA